MYDLFSDVELKRRLIRSVVEALDGAVKYWFEFDEGGREERDAQRGILTVSAPRAPGIYALSLTTNGNLAEGLELLALTPSSDERQEAFIYIGRTVDLHRRFGEHRRTLENHASGQLPMSALRVHAVELKDDSQTYAAESIAIEHFNPILNSTIQGLGSGGGVGFKDFFSRPTDLDAGAAVRREELITELVSVFAGESSTDAPRSGPLHEDSGEERFADQHGNELPEDYERKL